MSSLTPDDPLYVLTHPGWTPFMSSLTPGDPPLCPHPPRMTPLYVLTSQKLLLETFQKLKNFWKLKLSVGYFPESFGWKLSRNFWKLLIGNFPETFGWKLPETFGKYWKLSRNFYWKLSRNVKLLETFQKLLETFKKLLETLTIDWKLSRNFWTFQKLLLESFKKLKTFGNFPGWPPLCPHPPRMTPLYVLTPQDNPPLCPHLPRMPFWFERKF